MNQIIHNFQSLLNDMPILVEDSLLEIGLDAKALIQQRVQERGLDAKGSKTPAYSTPYAQKRKKKGRQINFMDLTDTGEMWRSIGFTEKRHDNQNAIVTIAGRDQLTQTKIDAHSEKRFIVLELSKEEEETLQNEFNEIFAHKIIDILERGAES